MEIDYDEIEVSMGVQPGYDDACYLDTSSG